jgi:putative MATE family efflux protein
VGSGVTASIARFIGAKDKVNADNTAEHAVALGLIISTILTTLGLIYGEDLLQRLGATESVLPLSWDYLKVSLIGLPFMVFSTFFRSILSGEGDMKLPMAVAGLGTILNIILDPIFIFTLGYGVGGAAMASVISQLIVFLIFVYMLFVKEHAYIRFRMQDFSPSIFIIKDIIRVGLPASMSMIIMAFGQLVFNLILVRFSTDAVAAYQVGGRMEMVIFLPIMAIASALTTLVGMFFGAKEIEKIKFIAKYGIIRSMMVTGVLSIILYIFAPFVVKIFTLDVDIQSIAVTYLRFICLIYPLIAIGMTVGRILQGLGKGLPMLVITSIRILALSAPLALYFIIVLNKPIEWVWYAMIISTIVSVAISLIWLKSAFKDLVRD